MRILKKMKIAFKIYSRKYGMYVQVKINQGRIQHFPLG